MAKNYDLGVSIEKRGKKYRFIVSDGLDENGKQIKRTMIFEPKTPETAPKKREAEIISAAVDFKKQVKNGNYFDGDKLTFLKYAEIWEKEWAEHNVTEGVKISYWSLLDSHVFPHIGHMKINKIKGQNCQAIITKMNKDGKAPKTVRRVFTAMNSVFTYAYKMGIIQENPCGRCTLPKNTYDSDLHYWEVDQALRFLNACSMTYSVQYGKRKRTDSSGNEYDITGYTSEHSIPLQFRVYFTLAIYGGFRRGELIALRWNDINFEDNFISINKAAAHVNHNQILKDTKTAAAVREIVLPDVCFDLLKLWREEQMRHAVQIGNLWTGYMGKEYDLNFIFTQNNGQMMSIYTPATKFREIIDRYNESIQIEADKIEDPKKKDEKLALLLPVIRLHDLRHTSATLLLSNGVDIETVSHRLGHARASITLDVYGHAMKSKDRSASDKLEALFSTEASGAQTEERKYS